MTIPNPGALSKTASAFEARMSTKYRDCPVCEGESTFIIRKVAVEDRKALITNQWLKKGLREGSRILCGEDYIDTVNFLARNVDRGRAGA